MKKKHYLPLLLIGSLFVFSLLPLLNYYIDTFRVLHHDYKNAYNKYGVNRNFLNVSYLLDNKEKYDTLLMGSSRIESLNEKLISQNAYNALYSFNVIGDSLHNLKVLLDNKVKIRNLWIGINDYDIWKNPSDHEYDYMRKNYSNDLISKVSFYSFYLLKKIDEYDIKILRGEHSLKKINIVIRHGIDDYLSNLKEKEDKARSDNPNLYIEKMTVTPATLLGYNDNLYRIDQSIHEIEEIKKLCIDNNIKLTIFTYPTFYKTYLQYNQYKIEEFKRKLSKIIDFYDFYDLNHIALNELNWRDSSHYTVSVGNDIIDNIQKNNFLVTKDNIDLHIEKTQKSIIRILNKHIPKKYIYGFNSNIHLGNLQPIFDLKKNIYKYDTNNNFEFKEERNHITMISKNNDPIFFIDEIKSKSKNVILNCRIVSEKNTVFQVFYRKTDKSKYNEKDSFQTNIKKGLNEFNLLIPSDFINNKLRIDLATKTGIYNIKDFIIYGIK